MYVSKLDSLIGKHKLESGILPSAPYVVYVVVNRA